LPDETPLPERIVLNRIEGPDGQVSWHNPEANNELIRVRHHTDFKGLKGIKKTQEIWYSAHNGKPYGVDVEVTPFMKPSQIKLGNWGKGSYIEFSIPKNRLISIPGGYMGGVGNAARIVTNGEYLYIGNLNARYVNWQWWYF
jgi:hypothetical protein